MDEQAGLRLCCLQTPEDKFSSVMAHIDKPEKTNLAGILQLLWNRKFHLQNEKHILLRPKICLDFGNPTFWGFHEI